MSVQTSYSAAIGRAYPGQLADGFNPTIRKSLIAEGVVNFGRAVSQGTNDDQALEGGTPPIGIAIRDHNHENPIGGESSEYADEQVMAILEEGYIFLDIVNTGAKGALLYSVDLDGTIGAGTAVAGQTQLTGAQLDETIASAGVARCWIAKL